METFVPPIPPPERAPDYGPDQQKPRWSVFELFKKAELAAQSTEAKAPATIEHTTEQPTLKPERRKFAAPVMSLLRGEIAPAPTPAYEASAEEAILAIDRVTAPSRTEITPIPEVQTAEVPQFMERAKEMGRGVLQLIGRVKQEVHRADSGEHVAVPTNLEPLAVADADIRAAMEELVAPIEAIQSPLTPEGGDAVDVAINLAGGGRELAFLTELKSPFARSLEVAASVATIATREAMDAKEKVLARSSTLRKVGLFALGAATAGGFVYTWNRIREVKKEQRELRRQHKRFEAEVRAVQEREARRLNELETTDIDIMTQPERQQYVQDVSDFAHARATEIRTTARMREVAHVPDVQPAIRHKEVVRPAVEQPVMQAEKASVTERIGAAIGTAKDSAGAAIGGAIGAGMALLHGRQDGGRPQLQDQKSQQKPLRQPLRQSSQAWLWGAMLGIAVLIFIFLWSMHIL